MRRRPSMRAAAPLLAGTFLTTTATAGEPYVFAEPRVGWMFLGEPPSQQDWVGGGLAVGGGYRHTLALVQFRVEGSLAGMGFGGDAREGAAGTFTAGGGAGMGFEIAMIDVVPLLHLGLGTFGDDRGVTHHFWLQPQIEVSGRIDHDDQATWLGARFGGDFFLTPDGRSPTSFTLGLYVAHAFQEHETGWSFLH